MGFVESVLKVGMEIVMAEGLLEDNSKEKSSEVLVEEGRVTCVKQNDK